ncbi:MAG: bifunctional glutamate N-acetyltransferase/amino-acid acetyltransferase ArgJ [Deltaproteobacteria bacterium]|nr:bifunctional glutamate N-acetyltransferase/amino-acid acetyltransferase ArgJ [Deltaproteobacteria bacterium]
MTVDREEYSVPGFSAAAVATGVKGAGKRDLSLIVAQAPAVAAGVFTTNLFPAAPVVIDRERIASGRAQAILVNSGCANAATGDEGEHDALRISRTLAGHMNIEDNLILLASTGVIGHRLPVASIEQAMPSLLSALRVDGIAEAQEGIMTTDRFPKIASRRCMIDESSVVLCGIAKGAGMIEPHMATMLAFVFTDAAVEAACLDRLLREAVGQSFNAVSVDGCMSTNDTAIMLAGGAAGNRLLKESSPSINHFREALASLMESLAVAIVRDGEGATKVVTIRVEKAASVEEARHIAYFVANSNLVKTAFYGGDPNWGRIISAVGAGGVALDPGRVELFIGGHLLFSKGQGRTERQDEIIEIMKRPEIDVTIALGRGRSAFRLYTSDLTHDYVTLNAHYHT